MSKSPSREPIVHRASGIHPSALDADAVRVVERLQSSGFEAYLVGGCVRDLLLGRQPKDFDVATSARPRQIRRVFRNCRIIGRRFKLAHVVFPRSNGPEHIIETATFRRAPNQDGSDDRASLLITDDNVFGNAAEDAARRDFTINGLFFDPRTWDVLDYVGGLEDLARKRVETIGDPDIRLREDPVRLLRAVKFASRLGFRIAQDTFDAMIRHAGELEKAAAPRLLEEILRLLRSGSAFAALVLLGDSGALSVLLPSIAAYLESEAAQGDRGRRHIDLFWRDLEALDDAVRAGDPVTPAFLHALLLYRLFERECDPSRASSSFAERDPFQVADQVFDQYAQSLRVPRFDLARAKQICAVQPRFVTRARKKFRPAQFASQEYFPEALALFRAHCFAANEHWETYDAWYQLYRRIRSRSRHGSPELIEAESRLEGLPYASTTFEELFQLPTRPPHSEPARGHRRAPARAPENLVEAGNAHDVPPEDDDASQAPGREAPSEGEGRRRGRRRGGRRRRGEPSGERMDAPSAEPRVLPPQPARPQRDERSSRGTRETRRPNGATTDPRASGDPGPIEAPGATEALDALSASFRETAEARPTDEAGTASAGAPESTQAPALPADLGGAQSIDSQSVDPLSVDPLAVDPLAVDPDAVIRTPSGVPVLPRAPRLSRARAPKEPLRFRIQRADSRFEFPEGPSITIEESPTFGDW